MKCRQFFMAFFADRIRPNLLSVKVAFSNPAKGSELTGGTHWKAKLVPTLMLSTLAVMSFAGKVAAFSTCQNKVVTNTTNLGTVTTNPLTVCETAPFSVVQCANLSFSSPGAFSIEHSFVGAVNCSTLTDEHTYTGTYALPPVTDVIYPKYRVVGLTYAPPGSKSTVNYVNGFQSGTSTSMVTTVANELTVTAKLTSGGNLFGFVDGSVSSQASTGWTQDTIRAFLWEQSRIPQADLRRNGVLEWIRKRGGPVSHASAELELWPITSRPENIILAVAGGGHPTHAFWMQAMAEGVIGREIRLPRAFEELLADADKDLGCGADVCMI